MIGCALEAIVLQGLFLLWMKANIAKFPSYATTTYPLGIQAVSIVSNIGAGYVIDMTNQRIPMVILAGALQLGGGQLARAAAVGAVDVPDLDLRAEHLQDARGELFGDQDDGQARGHKVTA